MSKAAGLKILGVAVCLGIGAAGGWFLRGMSGGGGMPPGMTGAGQMPPASVHAMEVQSSFLQPEEEYIALVEPVQDVMIRSEVSGTIETVHFTEGGAVNTGEILFTIDRRTYQAAVDTAKAELLRAQWRYDRLKNADERSVSRSDMESAESDLLSAQAAYDLAEADLERTEIKAPVSGRIGAALVRKGNYVSPASGALARIVQIDPVRVVFSMTDRDYLRLRQKELSGETGIREAAVRLPDGTILPTIGKKDFDDNAVNPQTGTIAVRYLFENREKLLIPGGYVTALLRSAESEKSIKIPQKSLLVDQQGTYVLTVDEQGSVGTARIEAGRQVGPDVIVLSGLKPGDRIITDGIQKAAPGATVQIIEK
jgi:RND family efflux transporter MFP subunit